MNKNEIIGRRFSKLIVISTIVEKRETYCICLCDCSGKIKTKRSRLFRGETKSCGCYRKEFRKTHGLTKTIEFKTWQGIIQRCYNTKNSHYRHYGGRGIEVCDRWLRSFENFLEDMGKRPSKKFTIDRINNDGNYDPLNCRWATYSEQNSNRRPMSETGIKYIYKNKNNGSFYIRIKNIHHGTFYDIKDALNALSSIINIKPTHWMPLPKPPKEVK